MKAIFAVMNSTWTVERIGPEFFSGLTFQAKIVFISTVQIYDYHIFTVIYIKHAYDGTITFSASFNSFGSVFSGLANLFTWMASIFCATSFLPIVALESSGTTRRCLLDWLRSGGDNTLTIFWRKWFIVSLYGANASPYFGLVALFTRYQ